MIGLGTGSVFKCGNGGNIKTIDNSDLSVFGIENGWVYWNDLYLNSYNDMTLDVSDSYNINGTVEHITGDPVFNFGLTASRPNGKTDVRISGLKPNAPYRLLFDGVLAKCSTGRAHTKTNDSGILRLNEVVIPNG